MLRRLVACCALAILPLPLLASPASATHLALCVASLQNPATGITYNIGPVFVPPSSTATFIGVIDAVAASTGFVATSKLCVLV